MASRDADEEFDQFAVAAWPRLRWTGHMLTGDAHLADDLAQIALVKTYAAWKRVRRDDAMAYSRKVLVNANIDRLRRRRLHEVSDSAMDVAAVEPVRSATHATDDRDQLVRLLARLTERERKIVVLRYYFDLAEATVADELGVSVGTVKSTAARALAKLRSIAVPTGADAVKEVN